MADTPSIPGEHGAGVLKSGPKTTYAQQLAVDNVIEKYKSVPDYVEMVVELCAGIFICFKGNELKNYATPLLLTFILTGATIIAL